MVNFRETFYTCKVSAKNHVFCRFNCDFKNGDINIFEYNDETEKELFKDIMTLKLKPQSGSVIFNKVALLMDDKKSKESMNNKTLILNSELFENKNKTIKENIKWFTRYNKKIKLSEDSLSKLYIQHQAILNKKLAELTFFDKINLYLDFLANIENYIILVDINFEYLELEERELFFKKLNLLSKNNASILLVKNEFLNYGTNINKVKLEYYKNTYSDEKVKKSSRELFKLFIKRRRSFTIKLSLCLSFVLLIFNSSLLFTSSDELENELINAYNCNVKTVELNCEQMEQRVVIDAYGFPINGNKNYNFYLDQEQLEDFKPFRETLPTYKVVDEKKYNKHLNIEFSEIDLKDPFNYYLHDTFKYFVGVNNVVTPENFSLTPIGNNSRFPTAQNEIIFTDYYFEVFKKYGYREYSSENNYSVKNINEPDDLIGKTFYNSTIVGVYKTEEDYNKVNTSINTYNGLINDSYINWNDCYHISKYIFFYLDEGISKSDSLIYPLSYNLFNDLSFINRGNFERKSDRLMKAGKMSISSEYSYKINCVSVFNNDLIWITLSFVTLLFALGLYLKFFMGIKNFVNSDDEKDQLFNLQITKKDEIKFNILLGFLLSFSIFLFTNLLTYLISILVNFACGFPYIIVKGSTFIVSFSLIFLPILLILLISVFVKKENIAQKKIDNK